MIRRFETYEDLVEFSERTGIQYKRVSLLKIWKKWRAGAKGHAKTCDHKGSIVDWDCACSFGCECCAFVAECTKCHSKLLSKTNPPMSAAVHLDKPPK